MKRLKRIVVLVAVLLLSLPFGLFSFSASAESKTTTISVDGIVEDCYIQRSWDATSTKYYPAWEGYQDGYGYGMRFNNLSGITSGYITVLFSDTSPIYVFSNGRKYIVKVSVINDCGWTDPTCFEMLITTGTAWAGGQPVDVSFSGDWTHLTFEFNVESSTGEQWYPYGFRYVFLKDSAASAPFYFGTPITIVATTLEDQIVGGIVDEDYGYTPPTNPNMDNGLEAGGDLLDQMTDTIDDFNANINANTQVLIQNVNKVKPVLDGVFGVIPLPVTATITGVVVFLVLRKVVGR